MNRTIILLTGILFLFLLTLGCSSADSLGRRSPSLPSDSGPTGGEKNSDTYKRHQYESIRVSEQVETTSNVGSAEPVNEGVDEAEDTGSVASPPPSTSSNTRAKPRTANPHQIAGGVEREQYMEEDSYVPTTEDKPYDTTFFQNYGVNPFINADRQNTSTFSMDVDTASYTIARRYLSEQNMPDKNSIRTEEFINYFDQDYDDGDGVFNIDIEGATSRFGNPDHHLLKIGVKAADVNYHERKPANMVFVIDVSGSMNREDRLGQVKKSLRTLAENLKPGDQVALVVYESTGRMISDLTSNRNQIFRAIDKLKPVGSTNAWEGLSIGYDIATRGYDHGKINRIILCSDGVANTGFTNPDEILRQIKKHAENGINLTCLGFGMGNYNDVFMEKLANHGDGNYYYIDSRQESDRILGSGAISVMQCVAKDAKIQVEFNSEIVDEYRLIGYENRHLKNEDFTNNAVDAGEIGAGQTVTALYEIKLTDKAYKDQYAQVADVRIRYKDIDTVTIKTNEKSVRVKDIDRRFNDASKRFRFTAAVVEFAEILKDSHWSNNTFEDVLIVAQSAVGFSSRQDKENDFIDMVTIAKDLDRQMLARDYRD